MTDTERISGLEAELEKAEAERDKQRVDMTDDIEMLHGTQVSLRRNYKELRNEYHAEIETHKQSMKHLEEIKAELRGERENPTVTAWRKKYDKADVALEVAQKRIAELEAELADTVENLRYQNNAAGFLNREGYRRCDISACNCQSWHKGELVSKLLDLRMRAEKAEAKRDKARELLWEYGRHRATCPIPRLWPGDTVYCTCGWNKAKAALRMNELGITEQDIADTRPPEPGR